jgi:hypothetical protein
MGCGDSRTTIPDEERAIIISANNFGFNDWSSQGVDYKVRKYSTNRLITRTQLDNIIINLRLAAFEQSKPVNKFYKSYDLHQTSELDFVKFVVSGIMLGCDPPGLKAKLLFEIFDVHSEGQLSKPQINTLMEIMVSVSFDHIPLLVDNERSPPASEESVAKYASRISRFRDNLLIEMESILGNEKVIKLKEFVKLFELEENERYVNDSSLRMICYKKYLTYRKSRKLRRNKRSHSQSVTQEQATGHTVGETQGHTVGETPGHTAGETPGHTVGKTPGNFVGETSGNTKGETTIENPGDSSGQAPVVQPKIEGGSQASSSSDEDASPSIEGHSEPDPIQV